MGEARGAGCERCLEKRLRLKRLTHKNSKHILVYSRGITALRDFHFLVVHSVHMQVNLIIAIAFQFFLAMTIV